jgi:hypothetical protein
MAGGVENGQPPDKGSGIGLWEHDHGVGIHPGAFSGERKRPHLYRVSSGSRGKAVSPPLRMQLAGEGMESGTASSAVGRGRPAGGRMPEGEDENVLKAGVGRMRIVDRKVRKGRDWLPGWGWEGSGRVLSRGGSRRERVY